MWEASVIGVVATLKVKEDKAAELEALFIELAATVRKNEQGCLSYVLTRSRTEPNTYKVLELYADQDAIKLHFETDYFKAAGPQIYACLDGKPEVEHLDGVE
jgi:quinol monooxygenase YgiN